MVVCICVYIVEEGKMCVPPFVAPTPHTTLDLDFFYNTI